jgi:tRNA(Arg) A34 adenosine deaminase TadA
MSDRAVELRKALTEADIVPAYQAAVNTAIRSARQAWADDYPDEQLRHARVVALRELAAHLGWDTR